MSKSKSQTPHNEQRTTSKARLFLLVDIRDFFSDLGSVDEKTRKKALKMTSSLVIFRAYFNIS